MIIEREDFDFNTVNFPFVDDDVFRLTAYGYISYFIPVMLITLIMF